MVNQAGPSCACCLLRSHTLAACASWRPNSLTRRLRPAQPSAFRGLGFGAPSALPSELAQFPLLGPRMLSAARRLVGSSLLRQVPAPTAPLRHRGLPGLLWPLLGARARRLKPSWASTPALGQLGRPLALAACLSSTAGAAHMPLVQQCPSLALTLPDHVLPQAYNPLNATASSPVSGPAGRAPRRPPCPRGSLQRPPRSLQRMTTPLSCCRPAAR